MGVTWSRLHVKGIICGVWCIANILQKPWYLERHCNKECHLLFFFPHWDECLPSPPGDGVMQAGHHTCKWFYWNQGLFLQLNSLACFGIPSFESTTAGKSIPLLLFYSSQSSDSPAPQLVLHESASETVITRVSWAENRGSGMVLSYSNLHCTNTSTCS